MKKQIVSTLLALCMLLCLMPTAAFAEESTETSPVCSCETACTAESMNADCPICGAEGALPENCAEYAQPADDAAAQPEGKVSDPQPETALTALIGGSETATEVSTADELTAAIAGVNFDTIKLAANIDISTSLTVNRPDVTLDLNGYTLTSGDTECDDIFSVNEHGNLTVKDSGTGGKIDGQNKNCGFCIYGGVLTLESGTITNCTTDGDGGAVDISSGDSEGVYGKFVMNGGAITNCKVSDDGGAVDIGNGCTFIMNSGTISGCRADDDAGAIFIKGNASFVMNGGTIENCFARNNGGAVKIRNTSRFTMNGGTISSCTAQQGGGVYVDGSSTFTMNGGSIASCTAVNGGNSVFVVKPSASFTITDGTVDGSIALPYKVGNDTVYMDGLGTAAYPYQISTADQLKLFHDIVNGENGRTQKLDACATLTADIVLNDGTFAEDGSYTPGPSDAALTEWSPMGVSNSSVYAGTFDGAGHTIQGLYRSANKSLAGLFGFTNGATIKNVKVTGYLGSAKSAGGIAAHTEQTTITGCVNAATVNAYTGGQESIGGIVGITELSSQIIDCINIGVIKCQAGDADPVFAGGIAGYLSSDSTISGCSNGGKVIGACNGNGSYCRSQIGGIVGIATLGTITDCYNAGSVTDITPKDPNSEPWVGGIVGSAPGHSSKYLSVTISNCYSTGSVTANNTTAKVGGITGNAENIAITNCYYLTGTAGQVCGKSDTASTVTNTTEKSAFDFANGGVLKLLKADRNDSPWHSCQYVAAAGITLPVFNGQGDAHDHQSNDWKSNETEHWQVCTCGVVFNKAAHSGGKATCKAKAVCEFCKASYGSLDPNSHADLKHVDAKAATAAEEGNIAYWYCDGCKKYFSDAAATKEITKAATVTAKLPPKITAGDGAAVTQGEKKELSFTSDASFADFLRVELDGTTLDEKNYTKKEGSTIITLNRDFVATLSVGEHTLAIVSKSGTATAKFTVKAKPAETTTPQPTAQPTQTAQPQPTVQPVSPIPRTGDTANPALWFALLIVSVSALAAIFVLRRKDNRK